MEWASRHTEAFGYTDDQRGKRTIIRYRLPFTVEQEQVLMQQYGIHKSNRMNYYQTLAFCVDRNVELSKMLHAARVASILSFSQVEQTRDDDGIAYILLETEDVEPITQKLLHGSVTAQTILDIIMRLSIILRDISKEPHHVIHRGLDLDEVYINADQKILLGGFYYAKANEFDSFQPYLPDHPANIPAELLRGDVGCPGADIQMLSRIAWNLFSGLPWNAQHSDMPLIYPEYAPEALVKVLRTGLACKDSSECNVFRRQLMDCRKALSKSDFASKLIPIAQPDKATYQFIYR